MYSCIGITCSRKMFPEELRYIYERLAMQGEGVMLAHPLVDDNHINVCVRNYKSLSKLWGTNEFSCATDLSALISIRLSFQSSQAALISSRSLANTSVGFEIDIPAGVSRAGDPLRWSSICCVGWLTSALVWCAVRAGWATDNQVMCLSHALVVKDIAICMLSILHIILE